MRILISAVSRFSKLTGICRNAANQALSLASLDEVAEVAVVIGKWQVASYGPLLKSPKIDITIAQCRNSSFSRNLWFWTGLPEAARRYRPDIVHLGFPLPFRRASFSVPVVTTVHDLYPFEIPGNFGYPAVLFNQVFFRHCIREVDAIACVSDATRRKLGEYFPSIPASKKCVVVYSSADLGASGISPSCMRIDRRFILTVGQHRANKNLALVIRAYHSLKSQGRIDSNLQLVVIGAVGPETGNLTTLVGSLGLQDDVLFVSGLPDAELIWAYQNCDAFVIASSTEGFCLPLAEALHFGASCVCSNIAVLREVAAGECRYFDLDARALENLCGELVQTLMQGRNRRQSATRFSKAASGRGYLGLYESLFALGPQYLSSENQHIVV